MEFRESNSAIWGQEALFRRQLDRLRDATVVLVLSAFMSWERDEGMIYIVGSEEDRRRRWLSVSNEGDHQIGSVPSWASLDRLSAEI